MAKVLISEELWKIIEPHIPVKSRKKCHPGRKPLHPKNCLTGILFVLMSGIPWEMLPQEMGCGSGMTCWRRLRDWQKAGVWQKIHEILLGKLRNSTFTPVGSSFPRTSSQPAIDSFVAGFGTT